MVARALYSSLKDIAMSIVKENWGPKAIDLKRHFFRSHHKYFGSIHPSNLPANGLQRAVMGVTDQLESNLCTGFGEAVSNSYEQGTNMSPEWQCAAESEYIGSEIIGGADAVPSIQASSLNGSLPRAYVPAGFTLPIKGAEWVCNWRNWAPSLWSVASRYLPGIPYVVDGPYDIFDNGCSALVTAYADNKSVIKVFGPWFASWNEQAQIAGSNGVLFNPPVDEKPVATHRWNIIDFVPSNGDFLLKAHMTQGTGFGAGGIVYFDRATINSIFSNTSYNLFITRSRKGNFDALVLLFQQIFNFLSNRAKTLFGRGAPSNI